MYGRFCGGDDLNRDPAWYEKSIEVAANIQDARSVLEEELGITYWGEDVEWFVSKKQEVRFVEPSEE
jgi:hypothetical protein